jgi:hypothetical protein
MRVLGIVLAIGALFAAFTPMFLFAQECDLPEGKSSDELVSYLDTVVPNRGNGACVNFAISKLGNQRYVPAVEVLTKFLYFHWPPRARQKQTLSGLKVKAKVFIRQQLP